MTQETAGKLIPILRMVGEKTHYKILHFLDEESDRGWRTTTEVYTKLNLEQGNASRILGRLLDVGLVENERSWQSSKWRVTQLYFDVCSLLAKAEQKIELEIA